MSAIQFATYAPLRDRWTFYSDSYWGGEKYRHPSSPTMGSAKLSRWVPLVGPDGTETGEFTETVIGTVRTYLVAHPGETREAFAVRVSLAAYVNVIQTIVDAYVDAVVGPVTRDLGALEQYLSNLNGRGRGWADHVEDVGRYDAVYGMTATVLDVPAGNPAANRADEERLGIGLRAILVHPPAIAWVGVDTAGTITEFAFVDTPYRAPGMASYVLTFWRYTTELWERHTLTVNASGMGLPALETFRDKLSADTRDDGGPLPEGIRGTCPVVFSFFREDTSSRLPAGSSLVGDACDLARQVYNELSWTEEIHRKTAFPFLAIPEKASGGQLDDSVRVQVGPDTALGYSSDSGIPSWVQPSAESTAELRTHCVFLLACALRTTGLEVTSESSSPDASGEALKVRARDFASRCRRFARSLQSYERQVLTLAARMLRLDASAVTLTYPKRFVLPDAVADLSRVLLLLQAVRDDLPTDALVAALRQALDSALDLSADDLQKLVDGVRTFLEQRAAKPPPTPPTPPMPPKGPPAPPPDPGAGA